MCGIFAKTGTNQNESETKNAIKMLAHRGPDGNGMLAFPNCVLGHTRLAIIELSPLGSQPMRDNARDIAITFNGEIYNHKELRLSLEKLGHKFTSYSDTEVVLKVYLEYGEKCPEYLDGMFAFAIWNNEKQELFMARDRFGKKPLYYAFQNGNIAIASEIKALFASGIKDKIDPVGIDAYLSLMYVPPWRTIYKNIQTLLPAHRAVFSNKKLLINKYFEIKRQKISISYEEAKEETRRLFSEAIKKRMIATDVEVGSFLSGGVDSTLVTAVASRFSEKPIKTFSFGYDGETSELPFAEQAVKTIGSSHYTLQTSANNIINELEVVLSYFDEPHGDSSDFPQHLISKLASSHVKVALTGDGGDEFFLGYGWYFSYWNKSKIIRLKNALFSNPYQEHLKNITVFSEKLRKKITRDASTTGVELVDFLVAKSNKNGIDKINEFDITTYLPGQLLAKADQMSMMHGLEVRSPFLDHKLAEFAVNLPIEYKTNLKTGKMILKDLLSEIMPRKFVDRKKQGFGAPARRWLTEKNVRSYIEKNFNNDALIYNFLKKDAILDFIKRVYGLQHPKSFYQLWTLLCLEIWLRKHKNLL